MRGRYSSFEVLPSIHLSEALLFLHSEGKRATSFNAAHLSSANCRVRVIVTTARPLVFLCGGSGLDRRDLARLENILHTANEEYAQLKKDCSYFFFSKLMTLCLSVREIYRAF